MQANIKSIKNSHIIYMALTCLAVITMPLGAYSINIRVDSSMHDHIQIGVFYGPTPELTTSRQFRWIKKAHVDFIQFVEDAKRQEAAASEKRNLQILDLAHKHKLSYYVGDPRVHGSDADIRSMVRAYKDHPATAGYYIQDEPGKDALDWPAKTYQTIRALDPDRVPYVNLLPDFVYDDYDTAYVEKWINKVGHENLVFLSFDNYPFLIDGSFRTTNFYNLDVIRRAGLKYGVLTSSYLQSMGIKGHYRRPTEHELRFSAYSNLAYGMKNLVWFTYNTPVRQPVEKFTNAIIDSLGRKTDLYRPFRRLNKQLHRIGGVLGGLNAVGVYHTGELTGKGVEPLPPNFYWQPVNRENSLIVTDFRHPANGQRYLMIVNKSLTEEKKIEGVLNGYIRYIYRISDKNGRKKRIRTKESRFQDRFLPGEGRIYQLDLTEE